MCCYRVLTMTRKIALQLRCSCTARFQDFLTVVGWKIGQLSQDHELANLTKFVILRIFPIKSNFHFILWNL